MNELLSLFTQKILKENDTKSARYAIGVLAECMRELESGETNKASRIQASPPYFYTHGQRFEAEIDGVGCEGKVSIESTGYIFLCQDKQDGTCTTERFGFKYCWWISKGTEEKLQATKVKNLILYPL